MTLRTERIRTLDQMRAFVEGNEPADFEFTDRTSAYAVIRRTLVRFEYHTLRKPDKGLVRRFLEKATGFSEAQMDRLIAQHRRTGGIRDHPPAVDKAHQGRRTRERRPYRRRPHLNARPATRAPTTRPFANSEHPYAPACLR